MRIFLRLLLCLAVLVWISINGAQIASFYQEPATQSEPLSDQVLESSNLEVEVPLLIPDGFPFPEVDASAFTSEKSHTFRITDAEFTLKVSVPSKWQKFNLGTEAVRFDSGSRYSGEVTFSTGCFGNCDTLERNIARSLSTHIRKVERQGRIPRVTHWHVHHKTWIEYSFLFRDAQGQAWLNGVTVKWSPQWLNAIRCEYLAPIDLAFENEEVLHFAWDGWAPAFIHYCRDFKVLSWE